MDAKIVMPMHFTFYFLKLLKWLKPEIQVENINNKGS